MKNLIDKYIKRIKVDYPEDDKLMIDLEDFAKEIKEQLLIQRVVLRSEQLPCDFCNENNLIEVGKELMPCTICQK